MIVEQVLALLTTVLVGVLRGIGALVPDVPGWVVSMTTGLGSVADYAASMSTWVPFGFVLGVAGSVLACVAAGFLIKLVRIVASFLTAGGGSAA